MVIIQSRPIQLEHKKNTPSLQANAFLQLYLHVLANPTHTRTERASVRSGASELFTCVEYSIVKYTLPYCNYLCRSRTSQCIRKLPDPIGVGLCQYSARTSYVTLSPQTI